MVPVLNSLGKPLFPCKERRATALMKRRDAVPYWQKGIFCIRLVRKETEKRKGYPAVAIGIDPGSKREGYTSITKKAVVLNITTNTPYWVKDHMETRRILRRNRRNRNTPYRKCRPNRSALRSTDRVPPSTRSRWGAKLRILKFLMSILPITVVNVEDIKAVSKEGKEKWNLSFSPLETGKNWFYSEVEKLGVRLVKTEGYETKKHRDKRGFAKSKAKLDYTWEAHNSDSHSLAEMALDTEVEPYRGLWRLEFHEQHRRQLHMQNFSAGGKRRTYGGTVSLGIPRCSVVRYKEKLVYVGGTMNGRLSVHNIIDKKRLSQNVKTENIGILYTSNWRVQFLPRLKPWVSLHSFS